MPDAADLQRAFAEALTASRATEARLDMLTGNDARLRNRFRLYRGNFQANAAKALANAYPVIRQLVGDEFFNALARDYQAAHASSSGDLNEYGDRLGEFCEGLPDAAGLPYLPDVARLEWLVHQAHYAADADPFEIARLAAVPPERFDALTPRLHPACALIASRWPIATIWAVHQDEHAGALEVDLEQPEHALVLRPRWRALARPIPPAAHAFLSCCMDAGDLATCTARALAIDPAFALQNALAEWLADAVIVDFEPPRT